MRKLRAYVLGLAVTAAGCGSSQGQDGTGGPAANVQRTGAALSVDYLGGSDVVGFHFQAVRVPCGPMDAATLPPVQALVNLQSNLTWGAISQAAQGVSPQSGHLLASVVLTLEPGCYDVTSTPASAIDTVAGTFVPSQQCIPASRAGIQVQSGQTTTVDPPLLSQCQGQPGPGNLDGRAVLNHPPLVTVRVTDSIGFQCQLLEVCAFISDPDNDPVATAWSELGMPATAAIVNLQPMTLIGQSGGMKRFRQCASIAFPNIGKRDFQVIARDLLNDGTPIEDTLDPMGAITTSRASMQFSLTSSAGFPPQCVQMDGTLNIYDPDEVITRAPGCAWDTPAVFYCSASNAMTFAFDLGSTCPGGVFAPAAVYPSCDGVGNGSDADADGVADAFDDCPGSPAMAPVNSHGCADAQLAPTRNESDTPYGLAFASMGDPGRAGGTTWSYTGIARGDLFHIYWVLDDAMEHAPYGISLDGAVTASETWTLSAMESNLAMGVAVFRNSTNLRLWNGSLVPLMGRMIVTARAGGMPLPWQTVAALGITPEAGQYALEVPGTQLQIQAVQEVWNGATWVPYLAHYDAAMTPPEAKAAYTSFGGVFYDE